jgi:purine-binding chemotaxis protein CheW
MVEGGKGKVAGPKAGLEPYLLFQVGGETFGLRVESIREIVSPEGLRPVSSLPGQGGDAWWEVEYRGGRIPALDARKFFGYIESPSSSPSILVVGDPTRPLGLLVEGIAGVSMVSQAELRPFPSQASSLDPGFIQGIGKVEGRPVFFLSRAFVSMIVESVPLADGTPSRS